MNLLHLLPLQSSDVHHVVVVLLPMTPELEFLDLSEYDSTCRAASSTNDSPSNMPSHSRSILACLTLDVPTCTLTNSCVSRQVLIVLLPIALDSPSANAGMGIPSENP